MTRCSALYANLPEKRSPRVPEEIATDVYSALRRLLVLWRDDPDRLAAACSAWALAGFAEQWLPDEVAGEVDSASRSSGGPGRLLSREMGGRLVADALRGRRRHRLRHVGEGVLLALEATAAAFERDRLHRVREENYVIECRTVSTEERVARLRAAGADV